MPFRVRIASHVLDIRLGRSTNISSIKKAVAQMTNVTLIRLRSSVDSLHPLHRKKQPLAEKATNVKCGIYRVVRRLLFGEMKHLGIIFRWFWADAAGQSGVKNDKTCKDKVGGKTWPRPPVFSTEQLCRHLLA